MIKSLLSKHKGDTRCHFWMNGFIWNLGFLNSRNKKIGQKENFTKWRKTWNGPNFFMISPKSLAATVVELNEINFLSKPNPSEINTILLNVRCCFRNFYTGYKITIHAMIKQACIHFRRLTFWCDVGTLCPKKYPKNFNFTLLNN